MYSKSSICLLTSIKVMHTMQWRNIQVQILVNYGKCSKILNTFLFLFLDKVLEYQTVETQTRLLLQKQTDLGLR